MCLLVVALDRHPDYRLVLIGHRDEFHARPTAPLGWWPDSPDILAGRDLAAGGTWLGLGRSGRIGVLTNVRDAAATLPDAPSRGLLIPDFLGTASTAPAHSAAIAPRATAYSGFNLLTWDGSSLAYLTNRPQASVETLPPGVYGLSNARLDTPWPKLETARRRVAETLALATLTPESLFAAIDDRQPARDEDLPDTGIGLEWERRLSAPFVVSPDYGTRCTTLVLAGRDGLVKVEERRYAPSGETTGRTVMAFHTTRTPVADG